MDLSVIAMIGIVMLIGIVKKNAIMMVDFALGAARPRAPRRADAIVQAAHLRFRPIMMTTTCALLGSLPIAHRRGRRRRIAPAARRHRGRRPAGVAVLTLFITPVVYIWFDRLLGVKFGEIRFFGRKRGKPTTTAPAE